MSASNLPRTIAARACGYMILDCGHRPERNMRQQPCSDTGIDDSPHNHDRVDDNNDNACNYDNDRVDIDDNHEYRPARRLHRPFRTCRASRQTRERCRARSPDRQLAAGHLIRSAGHLRIPRITRWSRQRPERPAGAWLRFLDRRRDVQPAGGVNRHR